jgi:AAA+ ATPase superfamily predicted ATPase
MQVIQRPVTGEDFFNREDILERLKAERSIAPIGQRKVGKTSIILECLRRNPDPQSLIAHIYILFEEPPPSFARKCLPALLISLLSGKGDEVDAFSPVEGLAAQAVQAPPAIARAS